jgi:hypothetical protein
MRIVGGSVPRSFARSVKKWNFSRSLPSWVVPAGKNALLMVTLTPGEASWLLPPQCISVVRLVYRRRPFSGISRNQVAGDAGSSHLAAPIRATRNREPTSRV